MNTLKNTIVNQKIRQILKLFMVLPYRLLFYIASLLYYIVLRKLL
jgi:hypothetical protein